MSEPTNLHDAIKGNLTRKQDANTKANEAKAAKATHQEAVNTRAQEMLIEQAAQAKLNTGRLGLNSPAFGAAIEAHFTKHTK